MNYKTFVDILEEYLGMNITDDLIGRISDRLERMELEEIREQLQKEKEALEAEKQKQEDKNKENKKKKVKDNKKDKKKGISAVVSIPGDVLAGRRPDPGETDTDVHIYNRE